MTLVIAGPSEREVQKQIKAIRSASDRIAASKETARAYLQKNGYITKSGKLTKRYGG
jgi:hypothetical protein